MAGAEKVVMGNCIIQGLVSHSKALAYTLVKWEVTGELEQGSDLICLVF